MAMLSGPLFLQALRTVSINFALPPLVWPTSSFFNEHSQEPRALRGQKSCNIKTPGQELPALGRPQRTHSPNPPTHPKPRAHHPRSDPTPAMPQPHCVGTCGGSDCRRGVSVLNRAFFVKQMLIPCGSSGRPAHPRTQHAHAQASTCVWDTWHTAPPLGPRRASRIPCTPCFPASWKRSGLLPLSSGQGLTSPFCFILF